MAKQKWVEAAIVLRTLVKKRPGFTLGALDLATSLAHVGRREEALTILSTSISREKGSRRETLMRRARVLSCLFLTNGTFQLYEDGVNLLYQKKYRDARTRFAKALELEPDNVEILVRSGQSLIMDGDFDSAAERLRLAKRLNPWEPEVSLWLGRAFHKRGELTEAVAELKVADLAISDSELAAIWLSDALLSVAQPGAAIAALESDIKTHPYHLESVLSLAKLRAASTSKESLWSARKDLQLTLSRIDQYETGTRLGEDVFERDLELDLRRPAAEIKSEAQKLLQQVQGRLDSVAR